MKAETEPSLCVGWRDLCECFGDRRIEGVCGSGFEVAKNLLEFGPRLFDGIQIGGVGRKVEQFCLALFDALPDTIDFVRAEIIHDQHIAGLQSWAQNLVQKAEEDFSICGCFNGHGGNDAARAHGAQKRKNLPTAFRGSLVDSLPARSPSIQSRHARGDSALIDKDQLFRRDRTETLDEFFSPETGFFCVSFAGVE